MSIKVKIIPVSGEGNEKNVRSPKTGLSVAEVLRRAKVSQGQMKISIGGRPAELNTHVEDKGVVVLTEPVRGS